MENELTIPSWPDYISPTTIEQFQHEFAVEVAVEIISSAVELMGRMHAPNLLPDVLCPPEYSVRELNSEGLLLPFDHSLLPNLAHLEAHFLFGRPHDPQGQVSVIKDWGTTGFMYRRDLVRESPLSWADFWLLAENTRDRSRYLIRPGR